MIENARPTHVYFGTYSQDRDESIFHGQLNPVTGELTIVEGFGGVTNPSFLALHPNGAFLYAVAEAGRDDGATAFAIDADTGGLTRLNTETTAGRGACHIGLDPAGNTAIVSYYGSGSIASFPIRDDGTFGPAVSNIQHEGSSVDPKRQQGPHAHSTNVTADGRFAVTADLGLDKLLVYRLDGDTGELTPNDPAAFDLHPGAGPRHFAFHPTLPTAYIINELDATMTAARFDAEAGRFEEFQTVSTLPADYPEGDRKSTAEVVVHPLGKFLYGSNRGHDSLVIYAVDPTDGALSLVGFQPSGGREPRNFNIDPTGRWLLAANQNTDDVQVFAIDGETGRLSPVGEPVSVPRPVCV
ncbi:MAG: lactonase family protein, partial [Planctomycetota bacterium]